MKRILAMGVILLFIGMSLSSSTGFYLELSPITINDGNTLYVGGSGPGNYSKIQDAINDAVEGDTVFVYDDSSPYDERIIIKKSINLIGENRDSTEIISLEGYNIIEITGNSVNLTGFTITNGFMEMIGIKIKSYNSNISGNNIIDMSDGIYLSNSQDNTIMDNKFSENWNCIELSKSSNNLIKNNKFLDNIHGIDIINHSSNNTVTENVISDISCCTFIGIRDSSNNNLVSNNTLKKSISGWGVGVIIYKSMNNTIIGNRFFKCNNGMHLWNSSYNIIKCNNIISTMECGIGATNGTSNNIIYHNNFIDNNNQAYDYGKNNWDNGYPSGGNYWDDYTGNDSNGDGIGDTPYNISSGDNQDRYPLMKPYGNDTKPPITTISFNPSYPNGDNGWYISNLKVELKAKDEGIGIKSIYYRINKGEWKNHSGDVINFVVNYDCLINGSIEYYAIDYSGNQEEINFVGDIYIDQLPPEVDSEINAYKEGRFWYLDIILYGEDVCSGWDRCEFWIEDGHQETITGIGPEFIFTIQWSKSFRNSIFYFYCYDRAGNFVIVSINGSDIESYPYSYNIFIWKWLERLPILNQLIIRIMERWSI